MVNIKFIIEKKDRRELSLTDKDEQLGLVPTDKVIQALERKKYDSIVRRIEEKGLIKFMCEIEETEQNLYEYLIFRLIDALAHTYHSEENLIQTFKSSSIEESWGLIPLYNQGCEEND